MAKKPKAGSDVVRVNVNDASQTRIVGGPAAAPEGAEASSGSDETRESEQ